MNLSPTRAVTAEEVAAYSEHGVVHLKAILPVELVESMAGPVDETIVDERVTTKIADFAAVMGADLLVDPRVASRGAPRGVFYSGVDHWLVHPAFEAFACRSPLAQIVAELLGSDRVWLYEDSVLVKEPGTHEETAIHQDLSYFHVDGDQICTTWTPLDRVDPESGGLKYVVGSHRWPRRFRPNLFVTEMPLPDTDGELAPQSRDLREAEVVSFVVDPGDVVVHHARTLHGAYGNASADRRRRAISVRYCGDDARYHIRRGTPQKPHHANVVAGEPLALDEPRCPVVWP